MKEFIKDFIKAYNEEYAFLYDNDDNVAGYYDAVREFDAALKCKYPEFMSVLDAFCKARKDVVSSDREAAAFMFTAVSMGMC